MKTIVLVGFFAAVLAVVCAKSCKGTDDCDAGQCCASYMPFKGNCKNLGKAKSKCRVDEFIFPTNDIYLMDCPCGEDFECVATVDKKGKEKQTGTCQIPSTEEPSTEETTTEEESTIETTTEEQSNEETTTKEQSTEEPSTDESSSHSGEETTEENSIHSGEKTNGSNEQNE